MNLILHNKNTEGLFSKTLQVSAFGQDDISLLQQSRVQKNITETLAAITMFSKKIHNHSSLARGHCSHRQRKCQAFQCAFSNVSSMKNTAAGRVCSSLINDQLPPSQSHSNPSPYIPPRDTPHMLRLHVYDREHVAQEKSQDSFKHITEKCKM